MAISGIIFFVVSVALTHIIRRELHIHVHGIITPYHLDKDDNITTVLKMWSDIINIIFP